MKITLPHISIVPARCGAPSRHRFLMMTDSVTIPDGNRATVHEMFLAQERIQNFVIEAEAKLDDLDDDMLHDFIVDRLHELATQYNQQLQCFSERQASH